MTRLRWNEYLLVTSSAQGVHDLDLLRRGVPAGLRVEFFDVTSAYAVLRRDGPAVPRAAGRPVERRLLRRGVPVRRTAARSTWPA